MNCNCENIEEILVIAGQMLPKNNEVTDDYEDIIFTYCPSCGRRFGQNSDEIPE